MEGTKAPGHPKILIICIGDANMRSKNILQCNHQAQINKHRL